MSTLLGMIPFELAKARGCSEDQAWVTAWYVLLALALLALALRALPFALRSYPMKAFREDFSVSNYLRSFAYVAIVLLVLSAFVWSQLQ